MSVDGFVLAGGASRRMGTDKARVPWQGQPMALVVARTLTVVCDRVALVRRAQQAEDWPIEVVRDPEHAGTHPLYGVAAALAAARTGWVVVAPCDVPRLRPDSVRALLGPGRAAVASDGHRRHPLVAVYPRAWASRARKAADEGWSVHRFAEGCVEVSVPAVELTNVNRPTDLGDPGER